MSEKDRNLEITRIFLTNENPYPGKDYKIRVLKQVEEGWMVFWATYECGETFLIKNKPEDPDLKEPPEDLQSMEDMLYGFKGRKVRITVEVIE